MGAQQKKLIKVVTKVSTPELQNALKMYANAKVF